MDTCRLRVKIGPYEMEAEGPRDFVEKHYGSFSERIPQNNQLVTVPPAPAPAKGPDETSSRIESEYSSIFRAEGKFVTLTAKPSGEDRELEALLLVLLGYREMQGAEFATADQALYGMRQSGFPLERADRLADRAETSGFVNITGVRRGTRYRLTNPGVDRAQAIARSLLNLVNA